MNGNKMSKDKSGVIRFLVQYFLIILLSALVMFSLSQVGFDFGYGLLSKIAPDFCYKCDLFDLRLNISLWLVGIVQQIGLFYFGSSVLKKTDNCTILKIFQNFEICFWLFLLISWVSLWLCFKSDFPLGFLIIWLLLGLDRNLLPIIFIGLAKFLKKFFMENNSFLTRDNLKAIAKFFLVYSLINAICILISCNLISILLNAQDELFPFGALAIVTFGFVFLIVCQLVSLLIYSICSFKYNKNFYIKKMFENPLLILKFYIFLFIIGVIVNYYFQDSFFFLALNLWGFSRFVVPILLVGTWNWCVNKKKYLIKNSENLT